MKFLHIEMKSIRHCFQNKVKFSHIFENASNKDFFQITFGFEQFLKCNRVVSFKKKNILQYFFYQFSQNSEQFQAIS